MPADRFIHPKCGHSEKVRQLTDLEYRVWTQYLLSADDFGVMRLSAVTLQADNDALAQRPAKMIQRCLARIVALGLVVQFQHQGRDYCCQIDWQEYQKIRYPRTTIEPTPPSDVLAKCSKSTQGLFQIKSRSIPETSPEDSGKVPETLPTPARAGGREEANGLRQTADGNGSRPTAAPRFAPGAGDADAMRAGDFVERYGQLHVKFRNGAPYVGKIHFDFQEALQLVKAYDDTRLDKLAEVWLRTDHDFAENGTRTMAKFRSMASWCDERLRKAGL